MENSDILAFRKKVSDISGALLENNIIEEKAGIPVKDVEAKIGILAYSESDMSKIVNFTIAPDACPSIRYVFRSVFVYFYSLTFIFSV